MKSKTRLITLASALTFALSGLVGCGDSDSTETPTVDESCLTDSAWYSENGNGTAVEGGQKSANAYGLYDMLGNAVEWVSDCYQQTYDGAPTDGSAWIPDESCEYRVIRGGCFGSTARGIRVSVREGVTSGFYGACAPGIRCVRDGNSGSATATVTLQWASIPAGTFTMGCSEGDEQCADSEKPAHEVTVAAFEMTAKEVTQQQLHDVLAISPATNYCPECAATYVSWEDAGAFCKAVGGRLATEAEWEYAARGGTSTRYYCAAQ